MSKRVDQQKEDDALLARAAVAVEQETLTPSGNDTANGERTLLMEYLTEEFGERKRKRDKEHAALLRLNENSRANAEEFLRQKKMKQTACNHQQPRGETNVRGQWLSNGKLFILCQKCQKSWFWPDQGNEIPQHLMPDGNDVGQQSFV